MVPMLASRTLRLNQDVNENKYLIEQSREYFMLAGRLYKLGKDGILRLCIEKNKSYSYVEQAHIAIGYIHVSPDQTMKSVTEASFKTIYMHFSYMIMYSYGCIYTYLCP